MGKYGAILVDAPWDNADSITPKQPFSSYPGGWPYPTMRISEVEKLDIPGLAGPNCHLYLWVMNSFLPHGCYLMQHWGFKYSQIITWVKPSGVGNWWVNRTQHMLFGYRGRMTMKTKCIDNVFGSTPVRHSEKPDLSYDIIEAASHGPYVEVFARRQRPGWDVWGSEVKSTVKL
jgi:N6-adenosine-specific RNA methylase IME4